MTVLVHNFEVSVCAFICHVFMLVTFSMWRPQHWEDYCQSLKTKKGGGAWPVVFSLGCIAFSWNEGTKFIWFSPCLLHWQCACFGRQSLPVPVTVCMFWEKVLTVSVTVCMFWETVLTCSSDGVHILGLKCCSVLPNSLLECFCSVKLFIQMDWWGCEI